MRWRTLESPRSFAQRQRRAPCAARTSWDADLRRKRGTQTLDEVSGRLLVFARPKVPCGVHWSFRVCLRHLGRGAGTGAPFPRTQQSGSPIWSARAPFSQTTIMTAGKQPCLSRGPPGTSGGRARGTGGSLQRKQECGSPACANSKNHRTARKLRFHLSRAPPETSDRLKKESACEGRLPRLPAANEQPPARASVTLLHYAVVRSEYRTALDV